MSLMEDCHRIGYCGVFYDRTFEQSKIMHNNILMIGVAFEA
jgi:5-formyltetrahydrofolate cyclo-ligase